MVDRRGRYQREMCGSRLGLGLVGGLLIGALAAPADAQPATRPYAPAARPDGAAPVALRATVVTPATARTAQSAAVVRFHGVPPQALAVRATGTSAAAVTAVADGSEVPVAIGEQVIVERKPLASDRPEAPLVIRDSAKQSLPAMILVGV